MRTGVDPAVTNSGVAEYRELNSHHLLLLDSTTLPDEHETLLSLVRTSQSKIEIAMAQRTRIECEGAVTERREVRPGGIEFRRHTVQVTPWSPVLVDSTTAVVTSRDAAIGSPRDGALAELNRTPFGVRKLLASHEIEWARFWDRYEVTLESTEDTPEHLSTQLAMRTHLFHAAQTLAPHLTLRDAGVPARGLHGEGYRGHIFWDELFILPVINMRQPHVTRSLLSYRWRRLHGPAAGPGDRPLRCGIPVAVRFRRPGGDSPGAVQPPLPPLAAGQLLAAVPRGARDRLQRVGVLRVHG